MPFSRGSINEYTLYPRLLPGDDSTVGGARRGRIEYICKPRTRGETSVAEYRSGGSIDWVDFVDSTLSEEIRPGDIVVLLLSIYSSGLTGDAFLSNVFPRDNRFFPSPNPFVVRDVNHGSKAHDRLSWIHFYHDKNGNEKIGKWRRLIQISR